MADDEIWDQECDEHGIYRHVGVHESGHAVAAIDNGIEFSHIAMYDDSGKPGFSSGLYVAAGEVVMLDDDPVTYIAPDPTAGARFLMAGHCAEVAVLGHGSPAAERIDMLCWRRGVGLPTNEKVTGADLDREAGMSFQQLATETEAWAAKDAVRRRISVLAEHLETLGRPAQLTYADVVALVGRQ